MEYVQLHPLVRILQCAVQPLSPHWNNDNYAAPYWRLYWNPTPSARVILNGRAVELRPDRLIVIPPDTPYAARCDHSAEHVYIHFLAQGRYRTARPDLYTFSLTDTLHAPAQEIRARHADPARELLLALTLAHLALSQIPADCLLSQPADNRIQVVCNYIDAQYSRPLTNPTLAAQAGLNTNAFIRLFRETMGETPQAYLRRRRIEAACVQLHYSDQSIEAIAAVTGFCDRFHFTKVFKQLRGVGPAAFRATRSHTPI